MNIINLQPFIILLFAFIGLLLGLYSPLAHISIIFVEIFLMLLLFTIFLSVDLNQLKKGFSNIKFTITSIIINFIISPIVAYMLGFIFLNSSIDIFMGFFMLLVTPCTDWYLVFTKMAKGNVELNLSILPVNLILQVILLPLYLYIFFSSSVNIQLNSIINSIIFVLFLPFILAMFTKRIIKTKEKVKNFLSNSSDVLQLIFLCLAVLIIFATEGRNLLDNYLIFIKLFLPFICFFIVLFFISKIASKVINLNYEDRISLHFTTLARNSPLALALAISAFPNQPLIPLALIIAPLIELPILAFIAKILLKK